MLGPLMSSLGALVGRLTSGRAVLLDYLDAAISSRADKAYFTNARGLKLDNLDATISTRSTYAGGAVASVTGAVGSVTGNVGGNVAGSVASVAGAVGSVAGNVSGNVVGSVASVVGAVGSVTAPVTAGTVSDKSGYTLSSAYDAAKTSVQDKGQKSKHVLLTSQGGTGSYATTLNISGSGHLCNLLYSTSDANASIPSMKIKVTVDGQAGDEILNDGISIYGFLPFGNRFKTSLKIEVFLPASGVLYNISQLYALDI